MLYNICAKKEGITMKVKIQTKEKMNAEIAQLYIDMVKANPKCVLGFATGSSPLGVYQKIIEAYNNGEVSFKDVTSFNLDEYVGLDESNDQSYRFFMNHNLFDHIDINKENTHVPCGIGDYEKAASEYDQMIADAGGIDLQILGIGSDGHIAFNEPGTSFDSLTHVAELAQSTINDNSRFFNSIEEVPTKAVTMGLASIMKAKKIVLIATGVNKADAIQGLLQGLITEKLPCSILRKHPDVTIYVDHDAYSKVKL